MPSARRKPVLQPVDTWLDYQTLFVGYLEAVNRSPQTIRTYVIALEQLRDFMRSGGIESPMDVSRDDMIAWLRFLQAPAPEGRGLAAASTSQRYRSIQAFYKFLVTQEGLPSSPLATIPQPKVPESLVPVIEEATLQRLMDSLKGTGFEDRRDRAVVSLFIDTGARLAEIAGLRVDDIDMEGQEVTFLGKGRRQRRVAFVRATRMDLTRYLMARRTHIDADSPAMFLGRRGPLKSSGIHQMLRRRCEAAGVPPIHAHQFRHSYAHYYLLNGGTEGDLMRDTGWTTRAMVDRYGRSAGSARAKTAHPKFSPRNSIK